MLPFPTKNFFQISASLYCTFKEDKFSSVNKRRSQHNQKTTEINLWKTSRQENYPISRKATSLSLGSPSQCRFPPKTVISILPGGSCNLLMCSTCTCGEVLLQGNLIVAPRNSTWRFSGYSSAESEEVLMASLSFIYPSFAIRLM